VLLVNLLAALNFANVFKNKKTFGKFKNVKKRDQNKKRKKNVFYIYVGAEGLRPNLVHG